MSETLTISDVCFSYGDKSVLQNLHLSVQEGEMLAITGKNGAGKSTLMEVILGRLSPSRGTVNLFGESICAHKHYRRLAFIAQDSVKNYRNFPTTVGEVVRIHLRQLKKRCDVSAILCHVGLEGYLDRQLSNLSGGELQRVALALALLKDAELILLDEPTTGIDCVFVEEFYRIVRSLANGGKTIIVITHHLQEIEEFADRILCLENGAMAEKKCAIASKNPQSYPNSECIKESCNVGV